MKNFKRFLAIALMGGILMTSSVSLACDMPSPGAKGPQCGSGGPIKPSKPAHGGGGGVNRELKP